MFLIMETLLNEGCELAISDIIAAGRRMKDTSLLLYE
jgi:hypothetical protein